MDPCLFTSAEPGPIAFMGGVYGNVPALEACIADAQAAGAGQLVFLGDITGCCGHSDEAVKLVRENFTIVIAGNHEQQAASGASVCGCGYNSAADEQYGCLAHQYAMDSLSQVNRNWMGHLPDFGVLAAPGGRIILCHGSPDRTNEFLYESELDPGRLLAWCHRHDAAALLCTHSGLPWVLPLPDNRVAVNCGVVGKPDHDGDPAVHYALVDPSRPGSALIRRVEYDWRGWTGRLTEEGVDPVFIAPLRTGIWTTGVESLPQEERMRPGAGSLSTGESRSRN